MFSSEIAKQKPNVWLHWLVPWHKTLHGLNQHSDVDYWHTWIHHKLKTKHISIIRERIVTLRVAVHAWGPITWHRCSCRTCMRTDNMASLLEVTNKTPYADLAKCSWEPCWISAPCHFSWVSLIISVCDRNDLCYKWDRFTSLLKVAHSACALSTSINTPNAGWDVDHERIFTVESYKCKTRRYINLMGIASTDMHAWEHLLAALT